MLAVIPCNPLRVCPSGTLMHLLIILFWAIKGKEYCIVLFAQVGFGTCSHYVRHFACKAHCLGLYTPLHIGMWLSLVERCVRDAEAGGSNPLIPTTNMLKSLYSL